MRTLIVVSLWILLCLGGCVAQDHQHGQHDSKSFMQHAHDSEHIKEHIQEYGGSVDSLKEDEMLFHFFKEHDTDKNNKLDGLELAYALTHYEGEAERDGMDEASLIQLVDDVLREQDQNNDGFIDYAEYALSAQSHHGEGAQ